MLHKQILIAGCCLVPVLLAAYAQHKAPSPPATSSFQAGLADGKVEITDYVIDSMQHGGLTRSYWYYVPNRQPTGDHALVFVLHGGSVNAASTVLSHEDRWRTLAELHGLIIIAPEGRDNPMMADSYYWNDCRDDAFAHPPGGIDSMGGVDDVGFIGALTDWAASTFAVDTNRVYCVGESNGGLMTFRLAQESPERFAAVASLIANMSASSECTPQAVPIPILILVGTADTSMPFNGGEYFAPMSNHGLSLSTQQSVDYWVGINQASATAVTNVFPDVVTNDNCTVTRLSHLNGTNDTEVIYYRVDDGGHIVPGPSPSSVTNVVGNKNRDIWAADEVWEFFSRHPASP